MKTKTLMHSSVIAAVIIAAIIGVSMVSGFPGAKPFISVDPISDTNTGSLSEEKYILVDIVGDRTVGDIFTVTGTTNLPAGTNLLVQIEPASFGPEGGVNGEYSGAAAGVDVIAGTGGTNTWSMEVNSSTLFPVKMQVNASVFTGNAKNGDFSTSGPIGTREFTLHPASGTAAGSQSQGSETVRYIRIDPVAETTTGDLLIVSGSTNFPSGTILMVQVGSFGIGLGSDTMVRAGPDGVNRYSMPADTSLLKPGTQTITVTNMKGDPAKGDYSMGEVNSTATFTLEGTYLGTDTPVQATITKDDYIRINAIGDKSVGDQFLITGTTSLPAGVNLIWQIMPYTGTLPAGLDLNARGIMANNPVTKGDSTANRVSLAVDLDKQAPGNYIVIVGEMTGDPSTRDIGISELVGSALFTVR
jgi:hypothetical protein